MLVERLYSQLYDLRRGKSGDHERPHKPALLLALIDLVDSGHFSDNRFVLDEAWRVRFNEYFNLVKTEDDRPNIHLPFYHLIGDGFWRLQPRGGGSAERISAPSSFAKAQQAFEYASVSSTLWDEIRSPSGRERIREALIKGTSKPLVNYAMPTPRPKKDRNRIEAILSLHMGGNWPI